MNNQAKKYFTPAIIDSLLTWYRVNRRSLPWRNTQDPYHIWLSEIMLQQTRVEAVKPYYARFLEVCPTVEELARLPEERLLKLWEGLGYYSRARNLQKAAQIIVSQYEGAIPGTYEELLKLPGVGEYTAGAIASIAFGERVPAVDGNVLRVLARLTGCEGDISDPAVKRMLREHLADAVPQAAGDFTQAMIELGATVCGPNTDPQCEKCPLSARCEAYHDGKTDSLPVKRKRSARRVEKRTVLLIRDGARTALSKRPAKGLLAGLYELPNVQGHLAPDEVTRQLRTFGFEPLRIERLEDAKHVFTHIEWHMIAYSVQITPEFDGMSGAGGIFLSDNGELHTRYAIPSAFSAYVKYL